MIRLHSCLLFVDDIAKSREYYMKFLELHPVEDLENFISFQIGDNFINLHLADAKSPLSTGGCVCYLQVANIDFWVKKATDIGGAIWRGPLKLDNGQILYQIIDPFGNVIGLESC